MNSPGARRGTAVSIRYARALFEAARESGQTSAVADDMEAIRKIVSEVPQIRRYCLASHSNRATQMSFIETAFVPYVGKLSENMLRMAVKNGRIAAIPFIPEAYGNVAERESDTVTVMLETPHAPTADLLQSVNRRMREKTGKDIKIASRVVPDLLGGFRISWNNQVIDLSAVGRLRKMRALITTS